MGENNELDPTGEVEGGFEAVAVEFQDTDSEKETVPGSKFSRNSVLEFAQLTELAGGEGVILFYPKLLSLDVGNVLFLRERDYWIEDLASSDNTTDSSNQEKKYILKTNQQSGELEENGVIVQIISKETATYPQADVKALFRLTTRARADALDRSYNEPTEVMDDFLEGRFKVRASIVNNEWRPPEGRVVTRNVDIFFLNPEVLTRQILSRVTDTNIDLGDYKEEPVTFYPGGFDKVNLITGMKGAGKSHIAKGIILECQKYGMPAVVFDINNEYYGLPNSATYFPTKNLKFRLDRIPARALIDLIERIAPFAERTGQYVRSKLPEILEARVNAGHVPDIQYLKAQVDNIIGKATLPSKQGDNKESPTNNMRNSYLGSLNALESFKLIMTEAEALIEKDYMQKLKKGDTKVVEPNVVSLSSVLSNASYQNTHSVSIFSIGGLLPFLQKAVVDLVVETLKNISEKQTNAYQEAKEKGEFIVPTYPTVYFEEAHMYMEPRVIDELIPLIRHYGMNLFFITNTPGALPDSVFRLVDNVIMTKMLSKRDIDQVKNCGLVDAETIEGFARDLPKHHALFLSGVEGATSNFPLAFAVRDFGLPKTGVTKSMWQAIKEKKEFEQRHAKENSDRENEGC